MSAANSHSPVMTTADLALKHDPKYRKIAERFLENPEEYRLAFAKAWFKLTHRDMGPKARYAGNRNPRRRSAVARPRSGTRVLELIKCRNIRKLKREILDSDLPVPELVRVAWASASNFRASDMRGGANGARIALAPQKDWEVNNPEELDKVLSTLREIRADFGEDKISLADLIVLAGAAAIEKAADDAGVDVGRCRLHRAGAMQPQEMTDVESFALLEPRADAFRNYFNQETSYESPTERLVDKADQLDLTVPEMTVLIGGMRALGANVGDANHGVLTDQPRMLSNDFFVNLLDMDIDWHAER
ncbi:MAG: peroxidase family protein [Gammaproteobacteria bacterium]|nr:peroxidase family protein [Gammaproteobacteria bacterium]